jgi:hypothetical protein
MGISEKECHGCFGNGRRVKSLSDLGAPHPEHLLSYQPFVNRIWARPALLFMFCPFLNPHFLDRLRFDNTSPMMSMPSLLNFVTFSHGSSLQSEQRVTPSLSKAHFLIAQSRQKDDPAFPMQHHRGYPPSQAS